jgi:hypothetical protein
MKRLNVNLVLGERPVVGEKGTLYFKDGHESQYDLIASLLVLKRLFAFA